MKNRTDKTARMATQLDPNPTQAKQERCRRKLRTRVTTLVAAAILASTELSFAEPVSLDLVPPMKGAVWAEDAARIELVSDDGTARTFTVTDFPVTIEAGSYTVMPPAAE